MLSHHLLHHFQKRVKLIILVKPQVDWLIDNGVHGLAAGGSTGEGHVLDREEYIKLMKTTVILLMEEYL